MFLKKLSGDNSKVIIATPNFLLRCHDSCFLFVINTTIIVRSVVAIIVSYIIFIQIYMLPFIQPHPRPKFFLSCIDFGETLRHTTEIENGDRETDTEPLSCGFH